MKQFQLASTEGGVQIQLLVVVKTKKEAAEIFGVSLHHLRNYASCYEPQNKLLINNPGKKFAYFDSGWLKEYKPDWFRKIMPYQELADYIRKINKKKYDKMFK